MVMQPPFRLADVELLSRPREVEVAGDGVEDFQVMEVQRPEGRLHHHLVIMPITSLYFHSTTCAAKIPIGRSGHFPSPVVREVDTGWRDRGTHWRGCGRRRASNASWSS